MYEILLAVINLVWDNEYDLSYRREGLIVSLCKKGDKEDTGNYKSFNPFECGRKVV